MALIINEQSAIMSNQTMVLFVKNRVARRLSVEEVLLFLNFGSAILFSISGWYQEKTSSA
jgi:hypothetical protein